MNYLKNIYIFLFAVVFGFVANAQDSNTSNLSSYIEEIVVTARATEESIRDIPVAITAYGEEEMENLNINSLDDIAASSASLEINRINSGSGVQIAIRGIASSPGSLGIEQSVAVMIDGVYFPQGRVINEGLFDTNQVAILKGPQALYFGKNATAGAVAIVTNDPGDEFEFIASASHEFEYESDTYEFVVSGPISDNWGARLAIYESEMDKGWFKNTATATTYTTVDAANGFAPTAHENPEPTTKYFPASEDSYQRLTLKGELGERTTLKLKASLADKKMASVTMAELFDCYLGDIPQINTGGVANPLPTGGECNKDRATGFNNIPTVPAAAYELTGQFGGELGETYESKIYTADLTHDFDTAQLRAILNSHEQNVAWVIDCDYNSNTSCFAGEVNDFENLSLELKLVSTGGGSLNWALGGYWQETERYFAQEVIFAGAENSAADPTNRFVAYDKISETDGETFSVYGELRWDINDTMQLTAGGRYIDESKDSYFIQPYVNPVFGFLFIEGRTLAADQSFDDFVPEVTFRYQPSDTLTYFLAYKEGWKSGGFDNGSIDSTLNSDPIADITYQPEHVEGFEAGVKALLNDGSLEVNFDIYDYTYDDLQLNYFNAATFAYRTLNAEESESRGLELQVAYLPPSIEGLRLTAAYGYNDSNYVKFVGPCAGGQKPSEGCNVPDGGLTLQNLNGSKKAIAPENRMNFGLNYNTPLSNGLEFGFNVNVKHSYEYRLSDTIPDIFQPKYTAWDAGINLSSPNNGWKLALIGRNLGDEYIQTSGSDAPSTGGGAGTEAGFAGDRYAYIKPGRTVALKLSYQR
ncbi:MAG: TonB-dependent receptor [Pseudomonadota bacterium]|nr:TonB-dependent receptor [Pseudomonadota bacterium]